MNPNNYSFFYEIAILFIGFFTTLKLIAKVPIGNDIVLPVHGSKTMFLCLFGIVAVAFFPIGAGSDKERYNELFMATSTVSWDKDVGWRYYVDLCKLFISDSIVFFIITSILYFVGNYIFFKALIPQKYLFYFLLATFGSLGYFAYGVNTMRAGIALSLFLVAFTKRNNIIFFLLFSILAVFVHKSMLILILALILTKYVSNSKIYIVAWLVFLWISILNIEVISVFIQENLSDIDNRVVDYLGSDGIEIYKSGFRYDFLLYSIVPIITGYYYIYMLKFNTTTYHLLYNVYIMANALWLLTIRIPFNDRFAYLSWFLYPFLMLFPLFSLPNIKNRQLKIAMIIGGIILLTFILSV